MTAVRFAWVGFHAEGLAALEALLAAAAPISAVLTLKPELAAKRSGGVDYAPICARYGVPLHCIAGINEPEAFQILSALAPDVVFVIGWHQIVRPPVMQLARLGLIGAHASFLPHNRGSAPINWAIMRGEHESGNTLMWLAEGVDEGDIIDQRAFPITPYDTCATLYARVGETNRDMLVALLPRLLAGERPGRPQPRGDEPLLRRRRPADGRVTWDYPARSVYDFVRALTRPYPGAFSSLDGKQWWIWEAALVPDLGSLGPPGPPGPPAPPGAAPGEVLGPVISPVDAACGQLVACGSRGRGGGGGGEPSCCSSLAMPGGRRSRAARSASSAGPANAGGRERPMTKRVLVIAAHPDDEVLGCGGTVALHATAGDEVTSVIVCEGESLRYGLTGVGQPEHIRRAAATLGVRDVRPLGFADQRLDTMPLTELIAPLDQIVKEVQPQVVYCQYGGDVNRDHHLLFQAVLVATRPTACWVRAVYAFDTASSTEWAYPRTFTADTWVDISRTLDIKLAAMACYTSELRPYPHPRSLDSLRYRARAWGNQQCLDAAEVFMTVRRALHDGQTPV